MTPKTESPMQREPHGTEQVDRSVETIAGNNKPAKSSRQARRYTVDGHLIVEVLAA